MDRRQATDGASTASGRCSIERGSVAMKLSASPDHHHTPEEEREIREAALDETIAATFPASDPLSTIPNPDDDEALEDHDER
jgi:hypothetical protein